ncbi:unnamed protein product [Pieris macdunnoughi]|uniref:Uncharacterized protein n=1 Tax=Pieris macdunnoughi TaxID=345717 RepID=A0A821XVG1_9NEOP|nr:unnamed protein product [Pieris macdunnoughi]
MLRRTKGSRSSRRGIRAQMFVSNGAKTQESGSSTKFQASRGTSAERGTLVTIAAAANAIGNTRTTIPYSKRLDVLERLFRKAKNELLDKIDPSSFESNLIESIQFKVIKTITNRITLEKLAGTRSNVESPAAFTSITASTSSAHGSASKRQTKRKNNEDLTKDVLQSVQDHFKRPTYQEDRYDIIGKMIALKLREFKNKQQQLLAEKIINETLFEAEMGNLTMSHRVMAPKTMISDYGQVVQLLYHHHLITFAITIS